MWLFLGGRPGGREGAREKIAEMRPRLTRMHKFRSLECEDFSGSARDGAPELGPGEFNAELDAKAIAMAFDKHGRDGQAKTQAMGDPMRDLGADWDAEEEKAALSCDPPGRKFRASLGRFEARRGNLRVRVPYFFFCFAALWLPKLPFRLAVVRH